MAALREIEHVVREYGMKGVAIDPYLAHVPASEARFYPIYAKCCELGIPVFITMAPPPQVPGAILEYAHPQDVDKLILTLESMGVATVTIGCIPSYAAIGI